MRGKIDLSQHKFANVYRAPAPRERWKAYRPPELRDDVYRQLVRLVDGAVRDAFANHPEYLTKIGQRNVRASVVKRVAGTLWGYGKEVTVNVSFAAQAARGRSIDVVDAPQAVAAETDDGGKPMSSTDGLFTWPVPVAFVEAVLGGGADFDATADKPVLVVSNNFCGVTTFAIDWRGIAPRKGEKSFRIPLTHEQARWPLADLRQAYEFQMI